MAAKRKWFKMNQQDKHDFLWYLGGILLTAPILTHLFYNMWVSGAHRLVGYLTIAPFIPDGIAGIEALLSFGFGFYFGLLALYSNDYRKRYQGLLLLTGTFVLIIGLVIGGLGLSLTVLNGATLVAGFIAGISIEGIRLETLGIEGELRSIDFKKSVLGHAIKDNNEAAKFGIASYSLVVMTVLAVLVGNVVFYMMSPPSFESWSYSAVYGVASLVFFYFLHGFITLNPTRDGNESSEPDTTSFEVLGPKASGKTYFSLALYLEILNNEDKYELEGFNHGIQELIKEYNNIKSAADRELNWSIHNTLPDEPVPIRFTFVSKNRLHPSQIEVNLLDHAGEILDEVSEKIAGEIVMTDGGDVEETEKNNKENSNTRIESDGQLVESDDELSADELIGDTNGSGGSDSDTTDDDGAGNKEWLESDESFEINETESADGSESSSDVRSTEAATEESIDDQDIPTPTASDKQVSYDSKDFSGGSDSEDQIGTNNESTSDTYEAPNTGQPISAKEKAIGRVETNIRESDKLVILLDSERFHGHVPASADSTDMQVENFTEIIQNVDVDDVVLVASKADFFIEDWQRENDHKSRPTANPKRFESFQEHVTEEMLADLQIKSLSRTTDSLTVHPVFFLTEERDGELVPKPDESGNIQSVGFENVLESIIADT